jgi:hypothetical protein
LKSSGKTSPIPVIAGLVPAIQDRFARRLPFWIAGTSPAMTNKRAENTTLKTLARHLFAFFP